MKILFVTILLSLFLATPQNDEMAKNAKIEAKKLCSCYKTFEKETEKFEKENKDTKERLKFSVTECLKERRPKKITAYLDSLDDEQKGQFKQKVFVYLQDCPNVGIK